MIIEAIKFGIIKEIKQGECKLKFTKMHGTGNDFILTEYEEIIGVDSSVPEIAERICERHFGVGADGLMFTMESCVADIKMKYYNSDGTKGEMCGNGIRCFARYAHDSGKVLNRKFSIETDAGIYNVELLEKCMVEVEMGKPLTDAENVPAIGGRDGKFLKEGIETRFGIIEASSVRMGVPHTVIFEEGDKSFDVGKWGFELEKLKKVFPEGTNVNFVKVLSPKNIVVETWERGAGKTLSCGTGVCASAYLANYFGFVDEEVYVKVPGGGLSIRILEDSMYMKGEAVLICRGDYCMETCSL